MSKLRIATERLALCIFIAGVAVYSRANGQSGIITTVAGSSAYGFSGDGGPATSAKLSSPQRVAVDASGNIYFVDLDNNRIRKISTSGIISTVAGVNVPSSGGNAFSGDGGPAISAQLWSPMDVAVDTAGNLYIADEGHQRVRKVSPAGIITTVAGSSTQPYASNELAGGFSGDGGPATSALLSSPESVAVDTAGNLFISDVQNSRIRKVSPSGIITTVAGNGSLGYSGDGGPATSASLDLWSAYPLGESGGGIAVDNSGNLFIADTSNGLIRKVTAAGIITTVTTVAAVNSTDTTFLSFPAGVAVDGRGNLFVADTVAGLIRKITAAGVMATVAGDPADIDNEQPDGCGFAPLGDGGAPTLACLDGPHGVAVDTAGNLFISDTFNNRIRKVTGLTSSVTNSITVVSNASSQVPVAPGSLISIYPGAGVVLSNASQLNASTIPLPISLGGTSVTINGVAAPLLYVDKNQINAQVPISVLPGQATVVVSGGGTGATGAVSIAAVAPGLFALATHGDGSLVSPTSPANANEYITLYGTGQGPVNAAQSAGAPTPDALCTDPASVSINGQNAAGQYFFCGLSYFVGVTQINAQVPSGLPAGNLPIIFTVNGVSSNSINIAVSGH